MILISHRGNSTKPDPKRENSLEYINEALNLDYDVEIDVWFDGKFYLGHDKPEYLVYKEFLENPKLWCHAKNIAAFQEMKKINIHHFWHQTDDIILTSKGFIWTYPGKEIIEGAIAVCPERMENWDIAKAGGICSDYIGKYK